MSYPDYDLRVSSQQSLDTLLSEKKDSVQCGSEIAPSLKTSGLRSVAALIKRISADEVQVSLRKNMTAKRAASILASDSNMYDVVYDEDLENSDLIQKSSNPLWNVTKSGSTLFIKRVK